MEERGREIKETEYSKKITTKLFYTRGEEGK
jgi:hypothetical protein